MLGCLERATAIASIALLQFPDPYQQQVDGRAKHPPLPSPLTPPVHSSPLCLLLSGLLGQ